MFSNVRTTSVPVPWCGSFCFSAKLVHLFVVLVFVSTAGFGTVLWHGNGQPSWLAHSERPAIPLVLLVTFHCLAQRVEFSLSLNPTPDLWHHYSMPKIHIPTPLRQYAGKQPAVEVKGSTVGEALTGLVSAHPDLRRHLYTDEGKLRAFVNVYLNDEDVRYLQKEATAVADGDNISIVPSIAGGASDFKI